MAKNNFERMIALADEFFETKDDPSQLSIDEDIMKQLQQIHPSVMGEETDKNGPIAWSIVIPTTHGTMEDFLGKRINEQELMHKTLHHKKFDSVYLCSALVLPEYRGKGLAKKIVCDSIREILKDHSIRDLYYWAFSVKGDALARAVADTFLLPLSKRKE